jgi:hypothetical protein
MSGRSIGSARRLLFAAAVTCLVTPALLAQGGGGDRGGAGGGGGGGRGGFGFMGGPGGMGMMRQVAPTISQESFDQYAKILNLTPEQRETAQRSFDTYTERYQAEEDAARESMRQAMDDARNNGNSGGNGRNGNGGGGGGGAVSRDMMGSMTELRKQAAEMEQAFMAEFKSVLTPEQAASFARVERARRRDKAATGLMVASGERVDLVKIVDGLSLSAESRASLTPLLEQYETDLDKKLIVRAKVNDDVAEEINKVREQANGDFAAMRDKLEPIMAKAREASTEVQDVNRRYTSKVQTALPEDRRPSFLKAVKESRFSDVYGPTAQMRAIDAALGFEDVDETQKTKIKALKAQYAKDLEGINARLAAAMEKSEAANTQGQGGPGMGMGRRPDPATMDVRREKGELGRDIMEQLKTILNADQQKRLPPVPQGFPGQRGQNGGPGGGGGGGGGGNNNGQPQRRNRGGGG